MTKDKTTKEKPIAKPPQGGVYKTSVSLPPAVKAKIDAIRGSESFSGQIVNDLKAYWAAADYALLSITEKADGFTAEEGEYISEALILRDWTATGFDHFLLQSIITVVSNGPPIRGDISVSKIIGKLEKLSMIELLGFVEWSRAAKRNGWSHKQAGAHMGSRAKSQ